jgi:hypothetical protein
MYGHAEAICFNLLLSNLLAVIEVKGSDALTPAQFLYNNNDVGCPFRLSFCFMLRLLSPQAEFFYLPQTKHLPQNS